EADRGHRRGWRAGAIATAVLVWSWGCRHGEHGADGKQHYTSYSAAGEVMDANGVVNVYAATGANALSPTAARARPLVYVPNSMSGTVSVIDPATYQVIRTFKTGLVPQHVVPSYDLTQLWVLNNKSGTATAIDPFTGTEGAATKVDDPYNMYYSPDGQFAIV